MKLFATIRQHLGWKLFFSYLLIVLIAIVVLDVIAELQTPNALTRNIAQWQSLPETNPALLAMLEANFQTVIHQLLIPATLAGILAALAASIFTTRRIVQPIQAMMHASQHIVAGDYHERLAPPTQDELGALAQSFNQMAEALDQTEHRRMDLIGNVAHELRTPLASIQSTLEGLQDGIVPSEPETFLRLEREVSRMQRLVRDLEELSRVEARQFRLDLRAMDITEVIGLVAERLRWQFEDKHVALRFDVPPTLPNVNADANRLTQVLTNLLGNALQYTQENGTVTVRVRCEQNELRVAIQDTGIGIAPEHVPHLFERFYRVDKSRSRAGGGSGIGLTIAQHLIEAHGGRIWVESGGLGQGSTFTFALPISETRFP